MGARRLAGRCGALGLVLAVFAPAATAHAVRGEAFEHEFANPSGDVRPKADWFLPDDVSDIDPARLEKEMADIARAGLGGVDLFHVPMALSADENDLLRRALLAAKANDVAVDLTIGAAFPPIGVPTITPGSGVEQQELVYGAEFLEAGQTFTGPVPEPQTDPARPRTLVAVIAARCPSTCTEAPPVQLERDSLTDLTESTTGAGELEWTAPGGPGEWTLFAFWRRSTETPYADYFSADATEAVTDYWDEHVFTPEIEPLVRDVGEDVFEDSLHLEGFQLWTRDFLSEFERRRGYSLRKYLPVTVIPYINDFWVNVLGHDNSLNPDSAPDFDFAGDAGRRIRNDYYQTLSELYDEHHLQPFNRWARAHGLRFRAKASYSQTLDIAAGASVDVPNTESFQHGNRIDGNRAMAGTAHLGRKSRLAVECCPTATKVYEDAYSSTWQQTLAVLHSTYAVGTNQVMLHGFAYGDGPDMPWPGAFWPFIGTRGIGLAEAYGPHQPYWAHMPDITGFLGREQLVLRQGQPKVDIAVYRHSYWSSGFPILASNAPQDDWFKDKTLERAGYSYDFVAPALFDLPNAKVDGGRLDSGGPAYKALVLDTPEQVNSVDGMPLAAAERILEYARAGLPVILVGEAPDRTGFFGDAAHDAAVRRTISRLLAEPSVRRVATEAEVAGALAGFGLGPDFQPAQPSNVLSAHRASDGVDFYFLYNRDTVNAMTGEPSPPPAPFEQKVSLAGRGQPYALDAWTGEIRKIGAWKQAGGRVRTRVSLAPGESTIIAIEPRRGKHVADRRKDIHAQTSTADEVVAARANKLRVRDTEAGIYKTKLSNGDKVKSRIRKLAEAKQLSSWHLSVEDWQPGASPTETVKIPHELDLDALKPWPEIPGLEDVSGVGRYTTQVDLGRRWVAEARRGHRRGALLDLGSVFDSVRVSVNGRPLPAVDPYDPVLDLRGYLKRGANTIEVEVATTLRNRLRTLPEYLGFAEVPRQPYGLAGPVRLVPYGEATIRTRGDRR